MNAGRVSSPDASRRYDEQPAHSLQMLVDYLAETFVRHELGQFAGELEQGEKLRAELPGDIASRSYTAYAFVAAADRRGLLDAQFFGLLCRLRARHMTPRIGYTPSGV